MAIGRHRQHPTIAQELEIARLRQRGGRPPNAVLLARRLGLTWQLVEAIIRWQARHGIAGYRGPEMWFGERIVEPGRIVRCPRCRAKLSLYVPGQMCRACRLRDEG